MKSQPIKKLPSARPDPMRAVLFAGVLFVASGWTSFAHAGVAGQITHLSGTLSAKRADGSSKLLSVKSEVLEGDMLSTETETYARIARERKVALVPFLLKGVGDVTNARQYFQADGIHPNASAQPIIMRNVLPELKKLLATAPARR